MIRRETDAALVNRIANHPSVLPHFDLAGTGALDFSECVAAADQYVILSDREACCCILEWSAPGVWQAHMMSLPEVRGSVGMAAARAMAAWMFDFGAAMIWDQVPTIARHTLLFNRKVGFEPAGIGHHHVCGEVQYFVMRNPDGRATRSRSSN